MTCPGFQLLLDYLDGKLDRAAAEEISAHLDQGCGQCQADRDWYQRVRMITSSDDSIEPPPWVLKRAFRVFDAPRVETGIAARVGRLVASLVFDSLSLPTPAGARSSGVEARQLLYRAFEYSIDVQVVPSEQGYVVLNGQILREGELSFESVAGLPLDLIGGDGTILSTKTNDRGEFTISQVNFGSCDLRVDVNELSIVIQGLPVASE